MQHQHHTQSNWPAMTMLFDRKNNRSSFRCQSKTLRTAKRKEFLHLTVYRSVSTEETRVCRVQLLIIFFCYQTRKNNILDIVKLIFPHISSSMTQILSSLLFADRFCDNLLKSNLFVNAVQVPRLLTKLEDRLWKLKFLTRLAARHHRWEVSTCLRHCLWTNLIRQFRSISIH